MSPCPRHVEERYEAFRKLSRLGWRTGDRLRHKKSGRIAVLGVLTAQPKCQVEDSYWVMTIDPPSRGIVRVDQLVEEFDSFVEAAR